MASPKLPKLTTAVQVLAHEDGYPLFGLLTVPEEEKMKNTSPVVILAPATAVPCGFYLAYLLFLAQHGIPSITFDWRGTHNSRSAPCSATLTDWGTKDLAGVITFISERFPSRRVVHFGHSVGGHVMPLPHNAHKISHAITIGTQNAFYPLTPFRTRHQIFWNVAVPAASSIFGYFPGSKLRIVGDLPVGVMQEWRSWAQHPGYVAERSEKNRERYDAFKAPVLAISVDDDEYATRLGVQLLHSSLHVPVQFWHIDHNDVPGKRPIRHVGFFTKTYASTLWPQTLPYLLSGELPKVEDLKPHTPAESDLQCRL